MSDTIEKRYLVGITFDESIKEIGAETLFDQLGEHLMQFTPCSIVTKKTWDVMQVGLGEAAISKELEEELSGCDTCDTCTGGGKCH